MEWSRTVFSWSLTEAISCLRLIFSDCRLDRTSGVTGEADKKEVEDVVHGDNRCFSPAIVVCCGVDEAISTTGDVGPGLDGSVLAVEDADPGVEDPVLSQAVKEELTLCEEFRDLITTG